MGASACRGVINVGMLYLQRATDLIVPRLLIGNGLSRRWHALIVSVTTIVRRLHRRLTMVDWIV